MAHYSSGREIRVGDVVRLPDGHQGIITRTVDTAGNEQPVTVEVSVTARLVEPL